MRRHVIIGRFGLLDKEKVSTASDEIPTELNLVAGAKRLDHGMGGALDDLAALGVFPTDRGLDLLVLAAHVHAADTRLSRVTESQDSWTREIRLVVPVGDPGRWTAVTALLTRMLDFLTGDRWALTFRQRPPPFAAVVSVPPKQIGQPPFDGLSLFSGGLDSLIGAIDTLERGGLPLFVSHAGEGASSDAQNTCFDALKANYKSRSLSRLRVWMTFPKALVRHVAPEDTTRGRSFLFIALGVFAGTGLSRPFTLRVPENGLIALNVPLDPLRLGSLSTRTTHPFYLARWNELLETIGIPGRVENPYWNKTKGEMVAACANQKLLQTLVPSSLSCSSPTKGRWRGRGIEHCGYCLPCLIRRAALEVAFGHANDSTSYTVRDLKARILNTRQSGGEQVRSLQLAVERLRSRPDLAKILIHKPGPLSDVAADLSDLAGVYRRGMSEVGALLAGVRARPN